MTISIELLRAINHLCTYIEAKILLAAMHYDDVRPTFAQIQQLTGIPHSNNYFKVRKQLIDSGYLFIDDNGVHVNTNAILKDYEEEFVC
jgi:hypothetical protein